MHARTDGLDPGGSGTSKLSRAAITVAGVASLVATLLSCFSIWLQLKNYRKPLLQRYVVRILLMVPIYAISSWVSLISLKVAFFVDPIRDVYEAFTIYTFFQLLINFLGGERSLIIMMHGRAPKEHLWPMNYILPKVDISDPHTFLAVKRGILQYAWMKPVLALASIVMKATGTYQEGYVGLRSGYFWSGIIYNLSVTLCLYSLGMFWACMSRDLQPFRPVPKFLCVKLIIFASYWQGFFLSILVWLGVIHDVGYYTPDNIARAIQDVLICFELPGFAIAHWYAFSWRDYADHTISAARLTVYFAFRDAFGIRDLIEDSKATFGGEGYEYRLFDPGENVLAHPESGARVARMMDGLRYERGGKGKYWIPKPTARTGLLSAPGPSDRSRSISVGEAERGDNRKWRGGDYGALREIEIDEDDETLYDAARKLEYGDYNYPVITAHEPWRNHRCRYMPSSSGPAVTTTATNQALLRPKLNTRNSNHRSGKGKGIDSPSKSPLLSRNKSASSSSTNFSDRSGLVDLVVEDTEAEEIERVRARKEGGPGWNETEQKRYVRVYPDEHMGEEVREGFDPHNTSMTGLVKGGNKRDKFEIGDEGEEEETDARGDRGFRAELPDEGQGIWKDSNRGGDAVPLSYGSMREERNIWGRPD
ncbi:organic solute transporter Ostalpha-domain-containing protein [Tuber brumale]|nr:organic solute transporter Ostalpha-domain-containing protein [Tuber brumale]